MKPDREHYTSIAPDEDDHIAALCGCTLERDEQGIVRMYQCPLHEAAPDLLVALEAVDRALDSILNGSGDPTGELCNRALMEIRAVRAKAQS